MGFGHGGMVTFPGVQGGGRPNKNLSGGREVTNCCAVAGRWFDVSELRP